MFTWLWALAVLLHLLYLPGESALLGAFTGWNVAHAALGIGAIALLCRPRSSVVLALVCALVPITAWIEAPAVGNHWLLASLVALVLLGAMLVGVIGGRRHDGGGVGRSIDVDAFPVMRITFLVAYGFAALSKFNSSFVDPTVSCANVFLDQVTRSVGLPGLDASSGAWWTHLVPYAVIVIETSVVVLLALAPTRVLGVLVALVFHGIIAIDTEHAFSDFSSVIAVLVVLFLPDDWFDRWDEWGSRPRARTAVRWATATIAVGAGTLLLWQSLDERHRWSAEIGHGRDAMWWTVGTAVVALVAITAARTRTVRSDVALLPDDRVMLAFPGVAVLIGLGPWLGVRDATSWNMYSNLVIAPDATNSWVVPGTMRLLDPPGGYVRIHASTDPALAPYIASGDLVPFVNLRTYTATRPDSSVTFERDGTIITVAHTRDDPALGREPEWWWRKVLVRRSIDLDGPARCQESFGALR